MQCFCIHTLCIICMQTHTYQIFPSVSRAVLNYGCTVVYLTNVILMDTWLGSTYLESNIMQQWASLCSWVGISGDKFLEVALLGQKHAWIKVWWAVKLCFHQRAQRVWPLTLSASDDRHQPLSHRPAWEAINACSSLQPEFLKLLWDENAFICLWAIFYG